MPHAGALRANFADLRGWAIFAQLFLGIGWLRATLAHAIEADWWDGSELTSFVAAHSGQAVDAYRPFVEELVMRFPAPISWGVLLLEFVTAVLLITNLRAEIGLTIGGFLNVHFILAGQVNPSVFYLVAAIGLLLWRLEKVATPRTARYHTRRAIALALVAIVIFGPSIQTFDPATAMEDPALVVIFLACLVAATIWLSQPTIAAAIEAPTSTGLDTGRSSGDPEERPSAAKPMMLDLRDPPQATAESTLPLMLNLQRLGETPSIRRRQHTTMADATTDAEPDNGEPDDQQPRIRDLAPRSDEPDDEDEPHIEVVDIA